MTKTIKTGAAKSKATSKAKPRSPKSVISPAADTFARYVAANAFQQGPIPEERDLTNITFWAGAGFSKAWDARNPVGKELFSFTAKQLDNIANPTAISRLFGIDAVGSVTPDQMRQIVYQLDMYERYPDVRGRYLDDQNVRLLRARVRAEVVGRFHTLAPLNYFDPRSEKFPINAPTADQRTILTFFRHMFRQADGSEDFVEGLRPHIITTNYDYVLETIIDNTLGDDDTLFHYTYRGFTPKTYVDQSNASPMFEHWLSHHLLKINGGFEILRNGDDYVLDYSERSASRVAQDPPVLMLPSREQDYSDPYFRAVFPKAVRLMRDSAALVLVGYSLPEDDALIRFIIRQFAEEPEDGRRKVIFYIDPFSSSDDKRAALAAVFPSIGATSAPAPAIITYEGGFADFSAECLAAWKQIAKAQAAKFQTLPA